MKAKHAMPVFLFFAFILFSSSLALAQDKAGSRYALVIGNGNYTELSHLRNAKNDAEDMAAALRDLAFEVTMLLDASQPAMEDALARLADKLASAPDSIGLFYFAGHGVQAEGVNYLIPADSRIPSEAYLKTKAFSLQSVLDSFKRANNALNIVILDACRDNPYQWARSGTRGLAVIPSQPVGSIIVYATSAGDVALDGQGRNGVFTGELLKYLRNPELEINEVFKRTGAAVQKATGGKQNPAIYSQYFGNIYLAAPSQLRPSQVALTPPAVQKKYGTALVSTVSAGSLFIDGIKMESIRAGGQLELSRLESGTYSFEMQYQTGERERKQVQIDPDTRTLVTFSWKPEVVITSPVQSPQGQYQKEGELLVLTIPGSEMQTGLRVQIQMRLIQPGTFLMGSRVDEQDRDDDEGPVHEVEITKPFYMGIYEVTQAQYGAVMGSNPSQFKGMDRPVENLTKANIDEFIERLNTMGIGKFRLPTEAEWEYACRAGTRTRFPWGDDPSYSLLDEYAWWNDTVTHPVGQKKPNPWGLYDMHGNVWEMCADGYGPYPPGRLVDPINIGTSIYKVCRGGSVESPGSSRPPSKSSYISYRKNIEQVIPQTMRSANRDYGEGPLVGFRLVREVD